MSLIAIPRSSRTGRRLIAIGAGLVVVYLGVLTGQRALDGYRAREEVIGATRQIESLRLQNLSLQAELTATLEESEIERLARNELGLVRPGDRPVVLGWPAQAIPDDPRLRSQPSRSESRWRAWLRVFFDIE
ncbi:MAG: septum formation initiator family protein [Chloroflexi bacterium]|nr:septum formation initiator family protein [Chloroflexota bacterium]